MVAEPFTFTTKQVKLKIPKHSIIAVHNDREFMGPFKISNGELYTGDIPTTLCLKSRNNHMPILAFRKKNVSVKQVNCITSNYQQTSNKSYISIPLTRKHYSTRFVLYPSGKINGRHESSQPYNSCSFVVTSNGTKLPLRDPKSSFHPNGSIKEYYGFRNGKALTLETPSRTEYVFKSQKYPDDDLTFHQLILNFNKSGQVLRGRLKPFKRFISGEELNFDYLVGGKPTAQLTSSDVPSRNSAIFKFVPTNGRGSLSSYHFGEEDKFLKVCRRMLKLPCSGEYRLSTDREQNLYGKVLIVGENPNLKLKNIWNNRSYNTDSRPALEQIIVVDKIRCSVTLEDRTSAGRCY